VFGSCPSAPVGGVAEVPRLERMDGLAAGHPTVVSRHYRVTACQPACAVSPRPLGTPDTRETIRHGTTAYSEYTGQGSDDDMGPRSVLPSKSKWSE
jgi:hypothetical protein